LPAEVQAWVARDDECAAHARGTLHRTPSLRLCRHARGVDAPVHAGAWLLLAAMRHASITPALTRIVHRPNARASNLQRRFAICIRRPPQEQPMPTNPNQNQNRTRNEGRGFAGMDEEQQRRIAQKGGEAVSRDRQHMSEIGRKGGAASGGGNRQGSHRER
jgi:general stress protein YciG